MKLIPVKNKKKCRADIPGNQHLFLALEQTAPSWPQLNKCAWPTFQHQGALLKSEKDFWVQGLSLEGLPCPQRPATRRHIWKQRFVTCSFSTTDWTEPKTPFSEVSIQERDEEWSLVISARFGIAQRWKSCYWISLIWRVVFRLKCLPGV